MAHPASPLPDDPRAFKIPGRKLGSSWYDWDGDIERHRYGFNQGPRLYFLLLFLELLVASALLLTDAWLMHQYFLKDFPLLRMLIVSILLGPLAVWWFVFAFCFTVVEFRLRRLALPWFSLWLTLQTRYLGLCARPFGIHPDRVGASCLAVTNALARMQLRRLKKIRPMVLLPRCMSAETVRAVKELAAPWACPVEVVASNRLARLKVREFRPTALIAVACERDLVSGIFDFGHKLPILVLANDRPFGPCLKASLDLEKLREALAAIHEGRDVPPPDGSNPAATP